MSYDHLRILQYNIRHGKESNIIPLLEDTRIHEFDILAIQEPWRNKYSPTSYCPSRLPFYLAYPPLEETRVCFYINKRLHPDSWTVTNHSEDIQTLTIRYGEEQRPLRIHNVYNPSPQSYTSLAEGTLTALSEQLRHSTTENIVIGDFNLHHPLWNGPSRPTCHAAADILLDIARTHSLELTTPEGTVTWKARGTHSTIDLTFVTSTLENRVLRCDTREDLAQLSDHFPVELTLDLQTKKFAPERKRNWKKLNESKLLDFLDGKSIQTMDLTTRQRIDIAVSETTRILTEAIETSVPWTNRSQFGNSFWTTECADAVRDSKRAYFEYLRENTPQTEQVYKAARNKRIATIRKQKQRAFRQEVAQAAERANGIWKLAKWAKTTKLAGQPPQLPELVTTRRNGDGTLEEVRKIDLQGKLELLRQQFFPEPTQADISDITTAHYDTPLTTPQTITEEEVHGALRGVSSDKAPGPDQITNRVLKVASAWLVPKLASIFTATFRLGYHPSEWKRAITLVLRKQGKPDYSTPKAYRPIALLNSMGKILERVIARRITEITETHSLLPDTQMGARKQRSTESALQLLTEQIHTIWNLPGPPRVATTLSMDISGAYDHVSHPRLLHNLRKRRIPTMIVQWVESFLSDRITKLKTFEGESSYFDATTGIPQGSPVSPIIFLFFIADLLEITNNEALRISPLGFVDDINLLTYSTSTERNCQTLERIHRDCQQWAVTHGVKFAPDKYELIHFSRKPRNFNMAATINIEGVRQAAKPSIRILGVQVDSKLRWSAHIANIKSRYESQVLAMGRISRSTWGASFAKARIVYSSIIRPTLSYAAGIWYAPQGSDYHRKGIDNQLETLQNKGLRAVTGAYKAVGGPILEKEAAIPPITAFLAKTVANSTRRLHSSAAGCAVRQACERIRRRHPTTSNYARRQPNTPIQSNTAWLRRTIPSETFSREILRQVTPQSENQRPVTWQKTLEEMVRKSWESRWTAYLASIPPGRPRTPAQIATTRNPLQLHGGLSKATSSMVTQIRTEKIGLRAFLHDRRVPNIQPTCQCGWPRQTAKHIIMFCPRWEDERIALRLTVNLGNYAKLLETPKEARIVAKWLQETKLLPQFQLGLG